MTRIPIVTFATGYGSTVEIDAKLFRAAEVALEEARQRQSAKKANRKLVGLIGAKASGFFGG